MPLIANLLAFSKDEVIALKKRSFISNDRFWRRLLMTVLKRVIVVTV